MNGCSLIGCKNTAPIKLKTGKLGLNLGVIRLWIVGRGLSKRWRKDGKGEVKRFRCR